MNNQVQEVEKSFTRSGKLYTQTHKTDKGYIYEVKDEDSRYYEVFKIKETEILSDFENKIGSGEFKHRYPGNNDFGVWAWCPYKLDRAIEILNSFE